MANRIDTELKFSVIDGVTSSLKSIEGSLTGVGARLSSINQASELVGKAFGRLSSAAESIGNAVSGAAEVEAAFTRLSLRTNATAEEQKALQLAVKDAVGATTFSAQEAAAALALLTEDGFTAKDAAEQLGTVLAFANTALIDSAQAAALLGTALDKFGEAPASVGAIADAITATAAAAGASTVAIAGGLAGIGTAAKGANVSVAESTAILGVLAVEGVESGDAVSRLNKLFQDFSEPASLFSRAIADAGLSGKSFADVILALQDDTAAAADVMATVGDKPREALRLLLQQGGGDLRAFTEVVRESGNASQEAADKINSNFSSALIKLTNQVTQTRDLLLTPILAPLTAEFEGFSKRIEDFTKSEQFARITEQLTLFAEKAIKQLGDFAGSFDFDDAVQQVELFVKTTVENFEAIIAVVSVVGTTVSVVFNTIKAGAAQFVAVWTGVMAELFRALSFFSDGAGELTTVFDDMTVRANALRDEGLDGLAGSFGLATEKAGGLKTKIEETAQAAKDAKAPLQELGIAPPGFADTIRLFGETADKLAGVKAPAAEAAAATRDVAQEFAIAQEKLKGFQKDYATAFDAGSDGAEAAFEIVKKAANEVARLSDELEASKESAIDLGDAFKDLGLKSQQEIIDAAEKARFAFDRIAESVRDGGAAQADVARAFEVYAARLRATAEGADDSTKRQVASQIELAGATAGLSSSLIAAQVAGLGLGESIKQSADTALPALQNVATAAENLAGKIDEAGVATEKLAASNYQLSRAAESAAIETQKLEGFTVGLLGEIRDGVFIINASADALSKQALAARDSYEALNEGARERRVAIEQEAALTAERDKSATAIAAQIAQIEAADPSLRAENQLRRQLNAQFAEGAPGLERLLALRLMEREEREAGLAVGAQELAQQQAFAGTVKPGTVNRIELTVNVSGDQNTQAYWRDIVTRFIGPELERLQRLQA